MLKTLRMALGFLLLLAGLILSIPGVPGPGIAVIILGLIILADHFHWARRLLDWTKQEAHNLRQRMGSHPPEPPPGRNPYVSPGAEPRRPRTGGPGNGESPPAK